MGIARTFQNIRLFNNLSVEDNVKIGLHNQEHYSALTGVLRLPWYWSREKAAHDRALELLSIFGMEDLANHQAGSLPYGAQRRLEIVRALATNPSLLLLDEPAAGMNPSENGGADGEHRQDPGHLPDRRHADRARHEAGHEHLRGQSASSTSARSSPRARRRRSSPTRRSSRRIWASRRRREYGTNPESRQYQCVIRRHPRHQGHLL